MPVPESASGLPTLSSRRAAPCAFRAEGESGNPCTIAAYRSSASFSLPENSSEMPICNIASAASGACGCFSTNCFRSSSHAACTFATSAPDSCMPAAYRAEASLNRTKASRASSADTAPANCSSLLIPSGSAPSCTPAAIVSASCFTQNGFSAASAAAVTCSSSCTCSPANCRRPARSAVDSFVSISRSLASRGLSFSLSWPPVSAGLRSPMRGEKNPAASAISPCVPGNCGRSTGRQASPMRTSDPTYTCPGPPDLPSPPSTSATTLS